MPVRRAGLETASRRLMIVSPTGRHAGHCGGLSRDFVWLSGAQRDLRLTGLPSAAGGVRSRRAARNGPAECSHLPVPSRRGVMAGSTVGCGQPLNVNHVKPDSRNGARAPRLRLPMETQAVPSAPQGMSSVSTATIATTPGPA